MINVLQAMILTDGSKMLLTPTYHVYKMYVPFHDATSVPVTFDAGTYSYGDIQLPQVDAAAARDTAGNLWLSMVNVDPNRSATITTTIAGIRSRGVAGEVLTATKVDSHNSFERPNDVAPKPFAGRVSGDHFQFELPPKSVAVVRVN
jgi:alpha-N-arabinofuranosidase